MSLPDAVQRVAIIYKNQHTHGAPREVVVKSMGYNSLNGASASAISALVKYGLLEGRGDDIKVSDRAMRIMHPNSPEEKAEALREAARDPELFQEIGEKFPGRMPADEVLRNYLIRDGFAPAAVTGVIRAYRETNEFVEREAGAYDPALIAHSEESSVQQSQPIQPLRSPGAFAQGPVNTEVIDIKQRVIAIYTFEGGRAVEIRAFGDVDTEEALETAEILISLKRKEISRNAGKPSVSPEATNDGGQDV